MVALGKQGDRFVTDYEGSYTLPDLHYLSSSILQAVYISDVWVGSDV